ncbi:MAG: hypothetical protein J0I19_17000 [Alphaproteobacteria bacterium]|nr:hypothetical protein [Alphaproteobacteria bacterium]
MRADEDGRRLTVEFRRSETLAQTKQLPPEDFYKIEQAYAEWHKDHPGTAR